MVCGVHHAYFKLRPEDRRSFEAKELEWCERYRKVVWFQSKPTPVSSYVGVIESLNGPFQWPPELGKIWTKIAKQACVGYGFQARHQAWQLHYVPSDERCYSAQDATEIGSRNGRLPESHVSHAALRRRGPPEETNGVAQTRSIKKAVSSGGLWGATRRKSEIIVFLDKQFIHGLGSSLGRRPSQEKC